MSVVEHPRDLDATVRVGCSLSFEVSGLATLLLSLQLAPDARHSILFEALASGNALARGAVTALDTLHR